MQRNVPARTQRHADRVASRLRVLNIATWIAVAVSAIFAVTQFVTGTGSWLAGTVNLVATAVYATIPLLYRFGELVAPLVFIFSSYVSLTVIAWEVGTGTGLQFYFLVAASVVVLALGVEHIVLASFTVAIGAALTIALEFLVPADTGVMPDWAVTFGFVTSTAASCLMIVATVWYALRETARAEKAMETEYQRSEALLANILPASIATRLKDPAHEVIADKYDDASILFADIAGYTKRASDTSPSDLVQFLDRLYTDLDVLVDMHGLEKVKTSGDSYMVVSGVPEPRPDHVEALAALALDMADAVADLTDPRGRAVPLRMGLAAGPVVAGVVGARKFFYDVWGDAVNVAARMETTDVEGRIQVPQNIYERLSDTFEFEERGEIDIKGKGVMRTWYLLGRLDAPQPAPAR